MPVRNTKSQIAVICTLPLTMPPPSAEKEEAQARQPGHDAHMQARHTEQMQYASGAELTDGGFVQVVAPTGEEGFGYALLRGC